MKKKCFYLGLLTCLAAVSSCSLESYEEPVEETYTKEFIKTFGLIDSNQDWNMVTRASVTVSTENAAEIKVYGLTNGSYRLMGDFADVQGTQLLQFDTPEGVTDLRVSNGTYAYNATVGGAVNFSNATTRAANIATKNGVTVTYLETTAAGYEIIFKNNVNDKENTENCTGVYTYQKELPEGKWNAANTGVTENFHFVSDGKSFVLYPVYWQTSAHDEVGIAYKDANGDIQKVKVYDIKSGDELMTGKNETGTFNIYWDTKVTVGDKEDYFVNFALGSDTHGRNISSLTDEEKSKVLEYIKDNIVKLKSGSIESSLTWGVGSDGTIPTYTNLTTNNDSWYFEVTYTKTTWAQVNGTPSAPDDSGDGTTLYKSRGIQVTVSKGLEYCFYVTNGQYTMYTRQNWNEDYYKNSDKSISTTEKAVHGATYTTTDENGTKVRCLAFEDWYGDGNDVDLNDLVFYTTLATSSSTPTIVNDDVQSYILAAEDLGNTDDYDFNDMVIKVSTPVLNSASIGDYDKWKVEVTALAAGGTLPLTLKWGDKVLTSPINNSEQFHSWFGDGNISSSTMINTTSNDQTGSTYTLYLSDTEKDAFSMSSFGSTDKMGGFTFEVSRSDGEYSDIIAPDNGIAPQMICVSDTWKWPTERTNISTAYPDFGEWGKNYTNYTWINNVEGPVIE